MELRHYGNDKIILNGKEYLFSDFLKLEPNYHVPYGFRTRVYRKGIEHFASEGSTTIYMPVNDPVCDRICNREGELARLVALLETEKQKKTRS